jgi:hypothetical protein
MDAFGETLVNRYAEVFGRTPVARDSIAA